MESNFEEIVKKCYLEILGRFPDKTGFEHHVNKMKDGKINEEQLKEAMKNSSEYKIRAKSRNFLKLFPHLKTKYDDKTVQKLIETIPEWYHTIKLGNVVTPGRMSMDYLSWLSQSIPLDLSGKSVLDIGTYDGFFSFLCESRGASRVLAIDSFQHDTDKEKKLYSSGFAVCKKVLNSKVEFRNMDLYDLENINEKFDLVLFFGVHYHLDNIVRAFQKIAPKVKDTLLLGGWLLDNPAPIMHIYGEFEMNPADSTNWWVPSFSCLEKISQRTGFKTVEFVDDLDIKDLKNAKPGKIGEQIYQGIIKFTKKS